MNNLLYQDSRTEFVSQKKAIKCYKDDQAVATTVLALYITPHCKLCDIFPVEAALL